MGWTIKKLSPFKSWKKKLKKSSNSNLVRIFLKINIHKTLYYSYIKQKNTIYTIYKKCINLNKEKI